MKGSSRAKLENFDPNASDPNDSDFEENPSSPPRRSSKKKKSAPARKKNQKRSRRNYSDDDILNDDDDISEESYGSPSAESEDEPEINENTGRPTRRATKKEIKYEESEGEEDIEDDELVVDSLEKHTGDKRKQQRSLIVKLKVSAPEQNTRSTRARSTRAASKSAQPEPNVKTRRSSRLSEDRDQPLQELGYTGRARSVRSATGSHSPPRRAGGRLVQGRKAPMKRPSTIMENSQEQSGRSAQSPDPLQPKEEAQEEEAQEEIQVSQAASVTSEIQFEAQSIEDAQSGEAVIQESEHEQQEEEDEDSDEGPVTRTRGRARGQLSVGQQFSSCATTTAKSTTGTQPTSPTISEKSFSTSSSQDPKYTCHIPKSHRVSQRELKALSIDQQPPTQRTAARGSQKRRADDSSDDFDPDANKHESEDDDSENGQEQRPRKRQKSSGEDSSPRKKSTRPTRSSQRSRHNSGSEDDDNLDLEEIADEAAELADDQRRTRRTRHGRSGEVQYKHTPKLRERPANQSYAIAPLKDVFAQDEQAAEEATAEPSASQRKRGGGSKGWRSLFSTQGPFGGFGVQPLIGSTPSRREPLGELDSDSSDDDDVNQSGQRGPHAPGAAVTPKSAANSLVPLGSGANSAQKDFRGGPANFGKIGGTSNADVSPVTVDENVNFDSVGGLDNHINQLKEMVSLPLLYPEVFQKFKITPPRGVLFHGPPGTGKTLLARALSNAVSANGKKVTFYMRKGADALSKWIGEAERQLRMLFEDARKNQPSIIFFDEIDGLAPVRSSKSEQSLASIVATLLALMDGMDDRGQVVIIGATNRPDNVDPALRRPGRFDREFYFPLPTVEARRAIIDIHTKNWSPPLSNAFKDQLAELTKGYGGADLRALCTEAAVNAVQGTFPQIYQSNKKLVIDTDKIKVSAKDFMISVNKIVPSSQRSSSFGAAPLPKSTTPLLKTQLEEIIRIIDEVIPPKQKLTALEEAQYDDRDDEFGFERENIKRDFDQVRVFRPRLLVRGYEGMGQQEIGAALLHKFENTHVQSFDLPSLLGDKDKTAEATLVQLFKEVRTHKPSVIYIPQVDVWYATVGEKVISIFISLLRTMPANEPVLILGTMEQHDDDDKPDPALLKDLFGFSLKNQYELKRPNETAREEFFENVVAYIRKAPKEYPEANRKKRKFEVLQEAPEDQSVLAKPPSKAELRTIKQRDRHILNQLKLALGPVMEQLKQKYKKFRTGIIAQSQIQYLMDEENPQVLTSDVPLEQRPGEFRPFELARDRKGITGLRETATGKFYYNMSLEMIEERLAHGYYKRPIDYFEDVKTLVKDAVTSGDMDRIVKANEIFANVEVDVTHLRDVRPELVDACEGVYKREQERLKALEEEARKRGTQNGHEVVGIRANVPPADGQSHVASDNTGPIVLDADNTGMKHMPPITPTHPIRPSPLSNGVSASDNTDNYHRHSNGSAGYGEDSAHLDDSQDLDSQHRDKRQKLAEDTQQSAPNTQTFNRSQTSGHTQMAPNTQPGDYQNSASTTTSGQKTSDHSSALHSNTQSTIHGVAPGQHPDFASGPAQSGGSQIPDTQEPFASSQPSNSQQSQSSQSHFAAPLLPPARQEPKIGSLLNSNEQQPEPHLILDDSALGQFHTELVRRSSGLSVEQLEQVNSTMMAAIWKERGDWNRIRVMHSALAAFNETIRDIEEMQKVWPPSQEKQNKQ